MCLNRQVDSIRITLQRRNLHRIENGLVRFSVNRVYDPVNIFKINTLSEKKQLQTGKTDLPLINILKNTTLIIN